MKIVFVLLFLLLALSFGLYKAYKYPYELYHSIVLKNSAKQYVDFKSFESKSIYLPEEYELNRVIGHSNISRKFWKDFHFYNFVLSLPYDHPMYVPIPLLEETNFDPNLGLSIYDNMGRFIFSFKQFSSVDFNKFSFQEKLFNLPLSLRIIRRFDDQELWKMLFTKKIPKDCLNCSYRDLFENIYILKMREKYFGVGYNFLSFYDEKKIGVSLQSKNVESFDTEQIYFLNEGRIYQVELKFLKNNFLAEQLRIEFMKSSVVKQSFKDARVPLFAEYQNLDRKEKRSLKSVNFLYSAWTHDRENEKYFKFLIQNLENYDMKDKSIDKLYKYSFKKFGSTFSKFGSTLKETTQRFLNRKIEKELEDEIKKESSKKVEIDNTPFESKKQKQSYLLQKALDEDESATNLEEDEDELRLD